MQPSEYANEHNRYPRNGNAKILKSNTNQNAQKIHAGRTTLKKSSMKNTCASRAGNEKEFSDDELLLRKKFKKISQKVLTYAKTSDIIHPIKPNKAK